MTVTKKANTSQHFIYDDQEFLIDYSHKHGTFNMKTDHVHDNYEVYYLLAGQRNYFIGDRIYTINKGDLVLIPKHTLHRTLQAEGNYHQRLVINFTDEFHKRFSSERSHIDLLKPFRKKYPVMKLQEEDRHHIEALLYRAITELREKVDGYELSLKAIAIEVLVHIARCSVKYKEKEMTYETPLHQKISEIAQYIQNHYTEHLSLKELSEKFYMSTYYLSRVFKEISGFSFVEYVNFTRMKEAQRLLRETDYTVLQIAERVGFESGTHFGRVFKQTVHLSPMQYRRMQRSAEN